MALMTDRGPLLHVSMISEEIFAVSDYVQLNTVRVG